MLPSQKNALSPERLRFLRQLQWLNYGQIRHLVLRSGQPHFAEETKCIHEFKPAGDNSPTREWHAPVTLLSPQVLEVFQLFDELQNGTIELVEVKAGRPFRLLVERPAR